MALTAIKGGKTLAELAKVFAVHPARIVAWKAQLRRVLPAFSALALLPAKACRWSI